MAVVFRETVQAKLLHIPAARHLQGQEMAYQHKDEICTLAALLGTLTPCGRPNNHAILVLCYVG